MRIDQIIQSYQICTRFIRAGREYLLLGEQAVDVLEILSMEKLIQEPWVARAPHVKVHCEAIEAQ